MAASYDFDVAVVGGGPAGMSAAIRVRWIKSYRSVACSVVVFESGELGGLATWRSCALTGPGFKFRGDGLVRHLRADFDRFHIPVVSDRIVSIESVDGVFVVEGEDGSRVRALSVIVATGCRSLANEGDFSGRGVFITYMGYEYFPELLQRAADAAEGRGLAIAGTGKSLHIADLVRSRADRAGGAIWVIDEGAGHPAALPGEQHPGRIVELLANPEGSLQALRLRARDGGERTLECGALLLDYNAFELAPSFPIGGLPLRRDGRGFVDCDRDCATNVPGVFVAGDITGRYASTAMALGDGVNAGFGAYRHVFLKKFREEPPLFAYAATDRPVAEDQRDLPPIETSMVPVLLGPIARAAERCAVPRSFFEAIDGVRSVADICRDEAIDSASARDWVRRLIEEKLGTVHAPG